MKKSSNSKEYVKKICLSGLFVALSVTVGWLCKTYLTFGAIRVTFENTPVILSGILFGPTLGAIIGVISDIVSCLTSPNPTLNPIVTLGAASIGLLSGALSRLFKKRESLISVSLSVFIPHILGSMIIKSIGLNVFFKYDFLILIWRVPLYIAISLCETLVIYMLLKSKYISPLLKNKKQ